MESEYVKRTVGICLSQGLAEVATVRPPDPIEYLAIWLLKFKANQEEKDEVIKSQLETVECNRQEPATEDNTIKGETTNTVDMQINNIGENPPAVQLSFSNLPGSRPGSKLSRIEEDPEVELDP